MSGIVPLNENIFTDDEFLSSYVTDRALPELNDSALSSNEPREGANRTEVVTNASASITQPQPSTSQAIIVSPEVVRPYPKAMRRLTKGGRKRGKSTILTPTPEKLQIEMKLLEKEKNIQLKKEKLLKKQRSIVKEKKVKTKLFKESPKERTLSESDDTDSDNYSTKSMSSTMALSDQSDNEDEMVNRKPSIDDWLLVKFEGEKMCKYFVGQVTGIEEDGLSVKFARKLDGSRFNWPPVEDISIISEDRIEMLLRPPIINTKNDRLTSFVFRTGFHGLAVF